MSATAAVIAISGRAERLDWVRERLDRQGLPTLRTATPPAEATLLVGDADCWDALCRLPAAPRCFVDISGDWFETLAARATRASVLQCAYLELAGPWHPCGISLGFALAVGCDAPSPPCIACPLLDALAPADGLYAVAGRAGAAGFCHGIAEAVRYLWLSQLASWTTQSQAAPDIAHWIGRLRQHDSQLAPLLAAAQHWRAVSPVTGAPSSFADTLADWLIASLPLTSELDRRLADWLQHALAA